MRSLRWFVLPIAIAFVTPALSQATVTYAYDDLARLSTATYSSKTITYTFDPAGNRAQVATATTTAAHAIPPKRTVKKSRKRAMKKR